MIFPYDIWIFFRLNYLNAALQLFRYLRFRYLTLLNSNKIDSCYELNWIDSNSQLASKRLTASISGKSNLIIRLPSPIGLHTTQCSFDPVALSIRKFFCACALLHECSPSLPTKVARPKRRGKEERLTRLKCLPPFRLQVLCK